MWSWVSSNAAALSAVASFMTLLVWMFYAQLLFMGFRRQRRARVLINQGIGNALDSGCLVTNMSHEPVYIQCLLITLHEPDDSHTCSITDLDRSHAHTDNACEERLTRQGPLLAGHFMFIGSFESLISQAAKENGLIHEDHSTLDALGICGFDITAIVNYGPDGNSIGFKRSFRIEATDNQSTGIRPETVGTTRLAGRRSSKRMAYWLRRMT